LGKGYRDVSEMEKKRSVALSATIWSQKKAVFYAPFVEEAR